MVTLYKQAMHCHQTIHVDSVVGTAVLKTFVWLWRLMHFTVWALRAVQSLEMLFIQCKFLIACFGGPWSESIKSGQASNLFGLSSNARKEIDCDTVKLLVSRLPRKAYMASITNFLHGKLNHACDIQVKSLGPQHLFTIYQVHIASMLLCLVLQFVFNVSIFYSNCVLL